MVLKFIQNGILHNIQFFPLWAFERREDRTKAMNSIWKAGLPDFSLDRIGIE